MTRTEGFYIESASTGRFRRYHGERDGGTRSWKIPALPNQKSNEPDVKVMQRFAFVIFLFLQGILSGLSLSALYEAFTARSPGDFLLQYAARSNETRRYFFTGISLCATGSLCMLDGDTLAQVLDFVKGRNTISTTAKSNMSIVLVLVYFVALLLTLLCSRVDVHISNIALQIGGDISDEDLQSVVEKWRGFAVPRSILSILGWLISCYRFVSMRSNVERDE